MKRGGRQHGMVRTYRILPTPVNPIPGTRFVTKFDSPPTAGLFTKVPSKPTSHSKFTGKCGKPRCTGCHMKPSCKSKDKTKGTQKYKHWRVIDRPGFNIRGFSATRMLEHFSNGYMEEDEVEDEDVDQVDYDPVNGSCILADADGTSNDNSISISEMEFQFQTDQVQMDQFDDEDWCFVESCS